MTFYCVTIYPLLARISDAAIYETIRFGSGVDGLQSPVTTYFFLIILFDNPLK